MRNKQWLLVQRPAGAVEPSNFDLRETDVPDLKDGQLLVKVTYLSLDPYMRGRMDDVRSYATPQPLGVVMIGGTVGEVVSSTHERYRAGDAVVGMGGWQQYFVSDGSGLRKVDTKRLSPSLYLGAAGMPGVTAWYGLTRIGQPKEGDTVVVSAASGAVGSVVGQLARMRGCRAVGIAGGQAKCEHVVRELGFDDCIDYKASDAKARLAAATAKGIDVLFENVGGPMFDLALGRMNAFGRVAVCGLIAGYDGREIPLHNVRSILVNRLKVEGFIVSEHGDVWGEALSELTGCLADGRLKYRESIAAGIESAPRAFIGLLKGENFGKQLVQI
jgi:NADPH-dependent curcumin reductase CurA